MVNDAFLDRADAGRRLADAVRQLPLHEPVVLALPRGGVPVAAPIARALGAPLDLVLVHKIGSPWQPELAVAAVADAGEPVLAVEAEVLSACGLDEDWVQRQVPAHWQEIERRRTAWLRARPSTPLAGRTAIVVDDGVATGTTLLAALAAVRRQGAAHVVVALPVAAPQALQRLQGQVDQVVCLSSPVDFRCVGDHYADFRQTTDEEVQRLLDQDPQR
jgi:putative phosphoribosyl transferase